jgi:hypothetical protein
MAKKKILRLQAPEMEFRRMYSGNLKRELLPINDQWTTRLMVKGHRNPFFKDAKYKKFDIVKISNGRGKNASYFYAECLKVGLFLEGKKVKRHRGDGLNTGFEVVLGKILHGFEE